MLSFDSFIEQYIAQPQLQINTSDEALSSPRLLIREARRRGWVVEDLTGGLVRFRSGEHILGGANYGISSISSQFAITTCNRKHAAKAAFAKSGLPIANGKYFKVKDKEQAKDYFMASSLPLVIKSSTGSMGDSVSVGLRTEDDFERGWMKAQKGLKPSSIIIIEEQTRGIDIRAYVVAGKMVAAASRVPAFVVGDGSLSVESLFDQLIAARKTNAYMRSLPVNVDLDWLQTQGVKQNSVLESGRVLTLNQTANTHQGASNFGITDLLSPALASLAERAAGAIPGANAVGIDLMIESLDDASGAVILEANASGSLLLHHYPAYGSSVDVAKEILDVMERQYWTLNRNSIAPIINNSNDDLGSYEAR